jgi:hypothetical protein
MVDKMADLSTFHPHFPIKTVDNSWKGGGRRFHGIITSNGIFE